MLVSAKRLAVQNVHEINAIDLLTGLPYFERFFVLRYVAVYTSQNVHGQSVKEILLQSQILKLMLQQRPAWVVGSPPV